MGSDRRRIHCRVSGRVQGVWFRASTQREAEALGITGWVRNLLGGEVELIAQGPREAVGRLEQWLRRGPPRAHVERLEVSEEVLAPPAAGFEILF